MDLKAYSGKDRRVMKKLLLINRKILRQATLYMFPIGCLFVVIVGVSIITGNPATISKFDQPEWAGYICFYGGIFFLSVFLVDTIFAILRGFKPHKKPRTLQDRVREIEQTKIERYLGRTL